MNIPKTYIEPTKGTNANETNYGGDEYLQARSSHALVNTGATRSTDPSVVQLERPTYELFMHTMIEAKYREPSEFLGYLIGLYVTMIPEIQSKEPLEPSHAWLGKPSLESISMNPELHNPLSVIARADGLKDIQQVILSLIAMYKATGAVKDDSVRDPQAQARLKQEKLDNDFHEQMTNRYRNTNTR
jgi:hypothetical protein